MKHLKQNILVKSFVKTTLIHICYICLLIACIMLRPSLVQSGSTDLFLVKCVPNQLTCYLWPRAALPDFRGRLQQLWVDLPQEGYDDWMILFWMGATTYRPAVCLNYKFCNPFDHLIIHWSIWSDAVIIA